MTRTAASLARVARWPYAGLPPKSTNSLITSSISARDPSGLPNGPTGSSRRRLLAIFTPRANRSRQPEKGPRLAALPAGEGLSGRRAVVPADACLHPVLSGFIGDVIGGVGSPLGGPYESGFDEGKAVEEPGDLLIGADDGLRGNPAVIDGLERGAHLRPGVAAGVADDEVASRGERGAERGDDLPRAVIVGDEVEDGGEQRADGLSEVDQAPGFRVIQDDGRVAQVGVDDGRVRVAVQDELAVPDRDGVVVDVDDAG